MPPIRWMRWTWNTKPASFPPTARLIAFMILPMARKTKASRSSSRVAGGAAHLPGMTAAMTPLPVFGVPVQSKTMSGQDSLYSIVQMPAGIPVGTLAIGKVALSMPHFWQLRFWRWATRTWQTGSMHGARASQRPLPNIPWTAPSDSL